MKISTRGRYGLKVVHYLAKADSPDPIPLSTISRELNLPENYLEQLMRRLRKSGLVDSVRGSYGGYKLSRPAKEIYVGEILRSLEKSMYVASCSKENSSCSQLGDCACQIVWNKIQDSVDNVIDNYSLDDMIEDEKKALRGG